MADSRSDRFVVLLGREEVTDHVLDLSAVPDEKFEALEEERFDSLLRTPGELMCSHGSKTYGRGLVALSEYLDQVEGDITVAEDTPGELCSYCWSNTQETLQEETEREETGVTDRIGTVGYRLRWKQKGRAREEWYDIVVRPETTMVELDRLVCRFSTLDDFHLRMYGLEDEYMDSSIRVVPDHQHSRPSDTKASEVTIADVAERASLWEGDRLSLIYDFGTPSQYYCIAKEVYEPEELDSLLAGDDVLAETETAAILDQKRL